jgi:mannitol/fructose-specific phosphotransferase system IIA component
MAWLQRTGNAMPHCTTRKVPLEEWQNERPYLRPWVSVRILPSYILRTVRKDNTFAYLGNFYSVPQGTFRVKDTTVMIWLKEEELHVHDKEGAFLCKHSIIESKGNTVINTDHKRDKSLKLKELLTQTASLFLNPELAMEYFEMIRKERGRYLRDQVQAIQKAIEGKNKQLVADVMQNCIEKKYIGAVIFRELLAYHESEKKYPAPPTGKIILLDPKNNKKADIQPDKSDLDTYEKAFENI